MGLKILSSVDYLLCGLHINMGGLDTHARTDAHTREKEGLGPPTNVQRCRGSFALRNRDRAEREREFYEW